MYISSIFLFIESRPRGNHESQGIRKIGAFDEDVEDIQIVVDYMIKEFGYVVDLIVGHSKGSLSGMRWVCVSPQASSVRGFVNVSGRYRMEVSALRLSAWAEISYVTG